MKCKIIIICIALLFSVSARANEVIDRVVAKVDGDIITLYDLERYRSMLSIDQDMLAIYSKLETEDERNGFLVDMLINEMLIVKEVEKNNIAATEKDVMAAINDIASQNGVGYEEFIKVAVTPQNIRIEDYKDMIKMQIEKMRFYSRFINSKVRVSEKEIITYFKENQTAYKREQTVGFHHVLFVSRDGNRQEAKESGQDFIASFKETGSFQESAEPLVNNEDVRITVGIKMKRKDLAADFKETINALSPGEISGLIENDSGYNIIILIEADIISLDSLNDHIERTILQNKRNKMLKSILSKLRQDHSIEINL